MTKARLQFAAIVITIVLLAAAAAGYFFAPARMLGAVGIESSAQSEFLVRTLAAAFFGMIPAAWAVRRRSDGAVERAVLIGLALYMAAGSFVDLHAYLTSLVGPAAIPSVIFRLLLGSVLAWLAL
jgi:hypothetical protein